MQELPASRPCSSLTCHCEAALRPWQSQTANHRRTHEKNSSHPISRAEAVRLFIFFRQHHRNRTLFPIFAAAKPLLKLRFSPLPVKEDRKICSLLHPLAKQPHRILLAIKRTLRIFRNILFHSQHLQKSHSATQQLFHRHCHCLCFHISFQWCNHFNHCLVIKSSIDLKPICVSAKLICRSQR